MSDKTEKTVERLLQQLEERDAELERMSIELQELTERVDGTRWGWALTRAYKDDLEGLPIPRLEMSMSKLLWSDGRWTGDVEWNYYLVYRHFTGDLLMKPFGHTRSHGNNMEWPREHKGRLALPIRDGAHIHHDSELLKLPAFVRCGDRVEALSSEGREHHQKKGREHRRPWSKEV